VSDRTTLVQVADWAFGLSGCHQQLRRLPEAEAAARRALLLAPDDRAAFSALQQVGPRPPGQHGGAPPPLPQGAGAGA
jgi:hypothetical protein